VGRLHPHSIKSGDRPTSVLVRAVSLKKKDQ
jgi:hypothetical protein